MACIDNFNPVREKEKSEILQDVEILREEQEKIMKEERIAWEI